PLGAVKRGPAVDRVADRREILVGDQQGDHQAVSYRALKLTRTVLPSSAPSSWNATRLSPGRNAHRTAPGQFRAAVHTDPSSNRTLGGSVVTVTVSPSRSAPCSMSSASASSTTSSPASGSGTNSAPVSVLVMVTSDAGPVIVHVGHASTLPGLNRVVAPSTCDDETDGNGSRKSTPVLWDRWVVTGTGSIQYGSGQYRVR